MLESKTPSMLLVDDDEVFRSRLARAFVSRGIEVMEASSVAEALMSLKEFSPDFAVVDLSMPGETGLDLLQPLSEQCPKTRTIVLTGFGSIVTTVEAMRRGAVNYLSKPADADSILNALKETIDATSPSQETKSVPDLKTVEWEHLQRVLHQCNGNISKAAKLLGMHRRSLQRKLARAS